MGLRNMESSTFVRSEVFFPPPLTVTAPSNGCASFVKQYLDRVSCFQWHNRTGFRINSFGPINRCGIAYIELLQNACFFKTIQFISQIRLLHFSKKNIDSVCCLTYRMITKCTFKMVLLSIKFNVKNFNSESIKK